MNRGHSIDAEWIMEKKDWRQSMRRERDAATPARNSDTTSAANPANSSLSTGNRETGADDTNTYQPGMDEMTCLLWAHGGSFHVTLLLPSLIFRWVFFRERGSGEVRNPLLGNN